MDNDLNDKPSFDVFHVAGALHAFCEPCNTNESQNLLFISAINLIYKEYYVRSPIVVSFVIRHIAHPRQTVAKCCIMLHGVASDRGDPLAEIRPAHVVCISE